MKTIKANYILKDQTDDSNPAYLFTGVQTEILVGIVRGQINCLELAQNELKQRGLDNNGIWVGFNK